MTKQVPRDVSKVLRKPDTFRKIKILIPIRMGKVPLF